MKRILLILGIGSFCVSTMAYYRSGEPIVVLETIESDSNDFNKNDMDRSILMTAGNASFTVALEDNSAVEAFIALLPLKVNMLEMNGNEKYYNLPQKLPVATGRPGKISAGDLLLWGSNTVVLFYETFLSSYSYTRLGRVNDPAGLATALGDGM